MTGIGGGSREYREALIQHEAADACAMMASSDYLSMPGVAASFLWDCVDVGTPESELASAAFYAATGFDLRERWAEAEARLRCGWTPGDVRPGARCRPRSRRGRLRFRTDSEGVRRLVVTYDGVEGYEATFTDSCTGCYEVGENGSNEHLYPYDYDAGCRLGSGCHECGYTGKRRHRVWTPFL